MARRTTSLAYNVLGQTLELFVRGARPTSATFKVFKQSDTDDATPQFSGTATLDAVNTLFSGAAGPSQSDTRRIPLASTTGIVGGKRYRIAQNALVEWVDIVEVGTTYVRARNPLQNDYTSGSFFQSTYLTAAVDSTFIQTLAKLSDLLVLAPDYRVRWEVVIAGATVPIYSFFDVVRAPMRHAVDIGDLDAAVPGIIDTLPIGHRADQGASLIDRAWSSVRADFYRCGVSVDAIREDEVIDELVILRSKLSLAEGGWAPPGMDKALYLQNAQANYDDFLEQHISVVMKHPVQT